MGVVYSSILLYPDMTLYFIIIPMPAYVFGLLYLWYSIYSMKNVRDNIGHEAHLGGAIAGFFLTIFIKSEILANSLIINEIGFIKIPKNSIGAKNNFIGTGMPGIQKICFQ